MGRSMRASALLLLLIAGSALAQTSSSVAGSDVISYTGATYIGSTSTTATGSGAPAVTSSSTSSSAPISITGSGSTATSSSSSSSATSTSHIKIVLRVLGPATTLSTTKNGNYSPAEDVILALNKISNVPWEYLDQAVSVGTQTPTLPVSLQSSGRRRALLDTQDSAAVSGGEADAALGARPAVHRRALQTSSSGENGVAVYAQTLFTLSPGQVTNVIGSVQTASANGKLVAAMQQYGVTGPPTGNQIIYIGTGNWPGDNSAASSSATSSSTASSLTPSPTTSTSTTATSAAPATPATPSTTSTTSSSSSGGSSTALIVAISVTVGVLAIVALVVGGAYYWRRRREHLSRAMPTYASSQSLASRWEMERQLAAAERTRLERERRAKRLDSLGVRAPSMKPAPAWPPEPPKRGMMDSLRAKLGLGGRDHPAAAAAAADSQAAAVAAAAPPLPQPANAATPPSTPPPPPGSRTSPPASVASAHSASSAPEAPMLSGSPEHSAPVDSSLTGQGRGGWAGSARSGSSGFGRWRSSSSA